MYVATVNIDTTLLWGHFKKRQSLQIAKWTYTLSKEVGKKRVIFYSMVQNYELTTMFLYFLSNLKDCTVYTASELMKGVRKFSNQEN